MHEAQLHASSSFVTMTYDDEHLSSYSLNYRDYRLFMRRARRMFGPFRFFMAGEYGEREQRPHFHAALFGVHFSDRYCWRKSPAGFQLYRSPTLEALWPHGNAEVGDVSFDSAAYIARYCLKKQKDDHGIQDDGCPGRLFTVDDSGELVKLQPEFARMSLRPAIGRKWFEKYGREVFPLDRVVVNGHEARPPRYYMKLLKEKFPLKAEAVRLKRVEVSETLQEDATPARLAVLEAVSKARLAQRKRSL